MNFSDFQLKQTILKQLDERGLDKSTPIQEKTIPIILKKQDLIACAKTGSGKTLAFVLPLINLLSEEVNACPKKIIRSLILVPTRELAVQIYNEAVYFSKNLNISLANAYGGKDYEKQRKEVQNGADLLVATPGRLLDFFKSKELFLEKVKYIVLDEADRMLDMGFIDDVKYILSSMEQIENISLWSATMDYTVFYSIWSYMNEPKEILINPESIDRDKVSQEVLHLGSDEKLAYTLNYCNTLKEESMIIFTNTRDMVDILANALTRYGIIAKGLSSVISQGRRFNILEDFKKNKFNLLVATDLASRGIHVDNITKIINYDVPQDPESYVHRIGRTARAGNTGSSLIICSERDYSSLERIESYLSYKIPIAEPDPTIISQLNSIRRNIRSNQYYHSDKNINKNQAVKTTSERNYKKKEINRTKASPSPHKIKKPATRSSHNNFSNDYPAQVSRSQQTNKNKFIYLLKKLFTNTLK